MRHYASLFQFFFHISSSSPHYCRYPMRCWNEHLMFLHLNKQIHGNYSTPHINGKRSAVGRCDPQFMHPHNEAKFKAVKVLEDKYQNTERRAEICVNCNFCVQGMCQRNCRFVGISKQKIMDMHVRLCSVIQLLDISSKRSCFITSTAIFQRRKGRSLRLRYRKRRSL